MMIVSCILLAIVLGVGTLEGCSVTSETEAVLSVRDPDRIASDTFKKAGPGRAKSWENLEPFLAARLRSIPRTKAVLSAFFEDWLGPSEPAALQRCKHLVEGPLTPQRLDADVFCYLLENKEGFKDYLVVDFRSPEKLTVSVATVLDAPASKDTTIPAAELEIAKQVGAVEVNVSGAADDGGPKPGWSIWFKDSEATPEDMRKARQISKLVAILLTGKGVTDEWLAPLKGHPYVTSVRLFSTSVTDEGLAHLRSLSSLKLLMLKDCPVTDRGIAALKAALPHCRVEKD
jgi:hypothetical protein